MLMKSYGDSKLIENASKPEFNRGDDSLGNNIFYQALREKERLIREYKFKYETTKALYEELLTVLIAQQDKANNEQLTRQHFTHVYQLIDDELSKLQVKRPDINRIKLVLMEKIDKIVTPVFAKSCSSGNWSSPKAMRLGSQHDTHTGKVSSSNNSVHSEPFTGKTQIDKPKFVCKLPPATLHSPIGLSKKSSHSSTLKEYLLQDDRAATSLSSFNESSSYKKKGNSILEEIELGGKPFSKSFLHNADPYRLLLK